MVSSGNNGKNAKRNKHTRRQKPEFNGKMQDERGKTKRESKQAMLIKLLERPEGATLDEMAEATGWQKHSVRGVMSGILKKRLGRSIASEKGERGRIYRMVAI
ncbi:MAG: DUF3489 domain-containing protein [Syntrophales bacterium]|jgi:hypothetical protein|nr:DUF3489 domain-containing protein [Syntrophales bacterium]